MVEAIRQGDIPGVQLRFRQPLTLSPESAWLWLVEPERLQLWLCDRAELEGGVGGSVTLETAREESSSRLERGDTLEMDAPRSWTLAFRQLDAGWQAATRLTLTVHPTSGGCELDVFHEGFEHLSLSICLTVWEEYRKRWRAAGARLASQSLASSTATPARLA